jgi:tetrahydromethanopterin S-methyltransferase subunit A
METEDNGAIKAKIAELKAQDPGAFPADAMVIQVKEAGGAPEEATGEVKPLSGELALIHARMKTVEKMVVDIGYRDRFAAGVYSGKIEGIMIGLLVIFIVLGLVLQLGMG